MKNPKSVISIRRPYAGEECLPLRGRRFWLLLWLLAGGTGISIQAQTFLNVTNFGAVGDAVQFFANTVSNSVVVTTTNQIPASAIGETIELFGCGTVTVAPNCQDMVATITDVEDGTNIYVSQTPQATLTNTFAAYGYNNQASFQAAIAACGGATNAIINIPAGEYLFLCTYDPKISANAAVELHGGGIHFVGAGMTNTTLLSQGAWMLRGTAAWRGFLFAIQPPITNDYPVSFENLTMDGGVQQGNTSFHGFGASVINGNGWDITHDAIDVRGGTSGNTITHETWTNVLFTHWRGEMTKSNDGSKNGNLTIINCVFNDGNATAINYYASLIVTNCVFNNMFQIAEYYQQYYTNTSYFVNNLCTNITANGFAVNGGRGNNPLFVIQGNTFYCSQNGFNTIETVPADNLFVISNRFIDQNNVHCYSIVLGSAGYQGTFDSSNIVVAGNYFYNPTQVIQIAGGSSSTDPTRVESVSVSNNTVVASSDFGSSTVLLTYGWTTNVQFHDNDCSGVTNGYGYVTTGAHGAQFILIPTNNIYSSPLTGGNETTNSISYANGSRYMILPAFHAGTAYSLDDTHSSQMPAGAQILIYNKCGATMPVYPSSNLTGSPVMLPNGQTATFYWRPASGTWSTSNKPLPPSLTSGQAN